MFIPGIWQCLVAIEQFLKQQGEMANHDVMQFHAAQTENAAEQERLIQLIANPLKQLKIDGVTEKSIGSWDANDLNRFLKENGFDIQLTPWHVDRKTVGAASVFAQTVAWVEPGTVFSFRVKNEQKVQGVRMHSSTETFSVYLDKRDQPAVVRLNTLNAVKDTDGAVIGREEVYLMPCTAQVAGWDLHDTTNYIQDVVAWNRTGKFDYLMFPAAKGVVKPDLSWLHGMELQDSSNTWWITQALQEVQFYIDEKGAGGKVGTAMAATRSISNNFIIDTPYVMWFKHSGLTVWVNYAHFLPSEG